MTTELARDAGGVRPIDDPDPADDLGAPLVPGSRPPGWRRPALYVAAAAAVVAAIAVPIVLIGEKTEPPPIVQPSPSPTAATPEPSLDTTPSPDPESDLPGADWRVAQRTRTDLDGDGTDDRVRIRVAGEDEFDMGEQLRVEADLSGRNATSVVLIDNGISFELVGSVNADVRFDGVGDGNRELIVRREGQTPLLAVLDIGKDGELVELRQESQIFLQAPPQENAPIQAGPLAEGADSGTAFDTGWFLRDGELFSYRSVESFPSSADDFATPATYAARLWAWRTFQDRPVLRPFEQSGACTRNADSEVTCELSETTARFFPAANTLDEGGSFTSPAGPLVALVDSKRGADVVVTTGSGERRLRFRSQLPLRMYELSPEVGQTEGEVTALVMSEGADSAGLSLVLLREDRLVEVKTSSKVPLGSGFIDEVLPYSSWVGPDGSLYTRVGPEQNRDGGPADSEPAEVYRWELKDVQGVPGLVSELVGSYCFDRSTEPPTVTDCG